MKARAWLRPLTCLKLPTATRRVFCGLTAKRCTSTLPELPVSLSVIWVLMYFVLRPVSGLSASSRCGKVPPTKSRPLTIRISETRPTLKGGLKLGRPHRSWR